jgi:hypothetical protein
MQLLESHHQSSDSLAADWQLIPVKDTPNQFELYLNLEFGQPRREILNGQAKLALRAAKLELELQEATFLPVNTLNCPLIHPIDQIFSLQPRWEIRHEPESKFLQGQQTKINLGLIESQQGSAIVIARVIVQAADLMLIEIEGLWRHDITPNKHAVLERKLAHFLQKTTFYPYVSQVVFAEENSNWQPLPQKARTKENQATAITNLNNLIQLIYQTPSDNFLELLAIAGLNPLTDLAGGDLTATNLSGINLNSANLKEVNLRGADLTDTDLSEANLQYAKLNGADLSGAYLEGANLSYASLQSASLALANLIGVNLVGANLTATNLQNASLAQVQVTNAIFQNNIGLTADLQQQLQLKGAIIKHN